MSTTMPYAKGIAAWRAALAAEIGVAVPTNNQAYCKSLLSEIRNKSGDPRMNDIVIFSPANGEVWLCKKQVEIEA